MGNHNSIHPSCLQFTYSIFTFKKRALRLEWNQLNTIMLQSRSRTRPCNVAQNGGSTSVCTTAGIERESCNTNQCREFQPIFYPDWIKFSLQVTFSQRLETARPYLALRRDLPAFSPSTSWESPTPAAPQSMETPHLGAPPRLMLTTTMSVVTGDTVMPPALSKVQK